jgi:FkbM family methyltransferase
MFFRNKKNEKLQMQKKQNVIIQKRNEIIQKRNEIIQKRNNSCIVQQFNTNYGLINLYNNDCFITGSFKQGNYWDEDTLLKLKAYINPTRNILEIGGHCGTSSIVYSSFLNNDNKIFVYEAQQNMFNLLVQNINQNKLQHKIIPYNLGLFCYEGNAKMNNIDLDGGGGIVSSRYNEENNLNCNFGGICLGNDGENINVTTIDSLNLDDIGFIHCDAQGSENFIFSKGIETITKHRPIILYENNELYGKYLYDNVCSSYPNYKEESKFDIKKYCIEELNYSMFIDKFNGSIDTLLIP